MAHLRLAERAADHTMYSQRLQPPMRVCDPVDDGDRGNGAADGRLRLRRDGTTRIPMTTASQQPR